MNACFKTILGTAMLASSVMLGTFASAQDIKDRTIKLALANTPESAHGLGAKRFGDIVSEKSGGKLKIRVYAGGSLGGEVVVASAMQGGTIEMSMMGPGLLTGMDKDFGIFDTPFLFDNFKEADAVLDGPVGKRLLDKLPAKGLVGLSYWDHGFRILTNSRRPVSKMEDIQGLKVRVSRFPSLSIRSRLWRQCSTHALHRALHRSRNQDCRRSGEPVRFRRGDQILRGPEVRFQHPPRVFSLLVLVSKKFWDQLSSDERTILLDAANETKPYERETSRSLDVKAAEELTSKGMTVTEISPEERSRIAEKRAAGDRESP